MTHVAIDEVPGVQAAVPMLGMDVREQAALRELGEATVAIGTRSMKRADAIAKARAALDVLERAGRQCLRCGMLTVEGEPHGPCQKVPLPELAEWLLGGPDRQWHPSSAKKELGGKTATIDYRVRLLVKGTTISVGTGPTLESAARDAVAMLPKKKKS